jgi:tRNA(fMet)-specific endonuclease VapC
MKCYLLDTNIISHIVKNEPKVIKKLFSLPIAAIYISVLTYAEIQFGLHKRPGAKALKIAVNEFLKRVDILDWDEKTAETYGRVRWELEQHGKTIDSLDLLIASHAIANKMILVSDDQVFKKISSLKLENWLRN